MAPKKNTKCACTLCRVHPLGFVWLTKRAATDHAARDAARSTAGPSGSGYASTLAAPPASTSAAPQSAPQGYAPAGAPHTPAFDALDIDFEDDPEDFELLSMLSQQTRSLPPSPSPPSSIVEDPFEDLAESAFVYEGPPTNLEPTPEVLAELRLRPDFTHSFVHHSLQPVERMGYLQAALLSVSGADIGLVATQLAYNKFILQDSQVEPTHPPTEDPKVCWRRLGIDADAVIQRFVVCDQAECCHLLAYTELANVPHNRPDGSPCNGRFVNPNTKDKRPLRVMSFVRPSVMLQTFLRDPAFVSSLQLWRNGEIRDSVGQTAPDNSKTQQSDVMSSIHDGSAWRSRDVARRRQVLDNDVKEALHGQSQRLVALEFGLQALINCDWFSLKEVKNYSVGAVYVSILNLPRHLSSKKQWTILSIVMPPQEPSKDGMNNIIRPLVDDLLLLERGILVNVVGRPRPERLHMQVLYFAADLPASIKLAGCTSYASNDNPCVHCSVKKRDFNQSAAFNWRLVPDKSSRDLLKAAAMYRISDADNRRRILKKYGVRWSEFMRLSSFEHSAWSPPDSMHNILLGMTKALVVWLVKSGAFDDDNEESSLPAFDEAITSVTWPSNIGRLPSGSLSQICLTKSAASIKADEWNRVRNALPVALWLAWRDINTGALRLCFKHDRPGIYSAVLNFCSFARVMMSRSITVADSERAGDLFSLACSGLLAAKMPLTINWHLAVHYVKFVELYGPVGGYSTWAFERANGMIGRTNLFRGDGVKATSSASRRWIKEQLLQAVLENPAPNASVAEQQYIERIRDEFVTKKIQGTLLIEEHRGHASSLTIVIPSKRATYDISLEPGIYEQIIAYLRRIVRNVTIKSQAEITQPGVAVQTKGHHSFPFVKFSGHRFTARSHTSSYRDRWAMAVDQYGQTEPCRVHTIIQLELSEALGDVSEEQRTIALVHFLEPADDEVVPWSTHTTNLGMRLMRNPDIDVPPLKVVPIRDVLNPVAITAIPTHHGPRIVIVNMDREGTDDDVLFPSTDGTDV